MYLFQLYKTSTQTIRKILHIRIIKTYRDYSPSGDERRDINDKRTDNRLTIII